MIDQEVQTFPSQKAAMRYLGQVIDASNFTALSMESRGTGKPRKPTFTVECPPDAATRIVDHFGGRVRFKPERTGAQWRFDGSRGLRLLRHLLRDRLIGPEHAALLSQRLAAVEAEWSAA